MNCKAGDLAVVIFVDGAKVQPNVGRIVRVIRRRRSVDYPRRGRIACWHVRSEGSPMLNTDGESLMEGRMPDIALRPIRPLQEKRTTKRREPVTA